MRLQKVASDLLTRTGVPGTVKRNGLNTATRDFARVLRRGCIAGEVTIVLFLNNLHWHEHTEVIRAFGRPYHAWPQRFG